MSGNLPYDHTRPIPGGWLTWILDDDQRTARFRSVLYPVCVVATIVSASIIAAACLMFTRSSTYTSVVSGSGLAALSTFGMVVLRKLRQRSQKSRRSTGLADGAQ
jgi:hypothetical protein